MTVEISILIAFIGCFIGLAGWLSGRDKKIAGEAEWRGTINAKLDLVVGLGNDIKEVKEDQKLHGERLMAVEQSAKQAHLRLDRMDKSG